MPFIASISKVFGVNKCLSVNITNLRLDDYVDYIIEADKHAYLGQESTRNVVHWHEAPQQSYATPPQDSCRNQW